jgi:hypothetical protein
LKAPPTHPRKIRRTKSGRTNFLSKLAAAFAGLAGISILLMLGTLILPAALNPWVPLRAQDEVGPLTKWKLQGFALTPGACHEFLREAGIAFTKVPDRSEQGFCHIKDAISMTSGGPPLYPTAPVMSCQVAAGLVIWERHGLKEAAQNMMASDVKRINHIGTYNCRRQYGRKSGWASEHASANAIDIQSFTFTNGETLSVLEGWNPPGGQPMQGANFLRTVQSEACDIFKVVLGPQANAAHENHFHLDMGPMSSCR